MTRNRSASGGRVWRWSEADAAAGAGPADLVVRRGRLEGAEGRDPVGPLGDPPGRAQPGLALLDAGDTPVAALARHPVLHGRPGRTEAIVEQAVLAPAAGGWSTALTVHDGWDAVVVRDAGGAEVTRLDRPWGFRSSGLDRRDRFVLDGRTWRPRPVAGTSGWRRLVTRAGTIGVEVLDPDPPAGGAAVRARIVADGVWWLRDDISIPLTAEWWARPTWVEQAVVLSLLGLALDADDSIHTD